MGVLLVAGCLAGCGGLSTSPTPTQVAIVRVSGELFRIALTAPQLVAAARAAQAGTGPRIPNGRIVAGTGVNVGWNWHHEDVE